MARRTRPSPSQAGSVHLPAIYLRVMLDACAPSDAVARRRLLEATHLDDPQRDPWPPAIGLHAFEALLANAARSLPPGWHLAAVPRFDAAVHGALGFAALSAPTLGAALEVLLTYGSARLPILTFSMRQAGSRVRLSCGIAHPGRSLPTVLLEIAVLALANFIAQYAGRDPSELTVLLPGQPRPYRQALAAATRAAVATGRSAHAVEFPRAWLSSTSPLADPSLHRLSVERCREQLARASGRTPIEEAVRQSVLAAGGRPPGLAAVAAARHVAPRTLMRHLREAGTSYQAIVDEVRAGLAIEYLRDTRLPLGAIAERLGFSDTSNFSRAFRSWFGRSPGSCRSPPA